MAIWLQAAVWGWVTGGALVIGAAIAYFTSLSPRLIAGIMAFGSGVLISALSLNLMEEAYRRGGFGATSLGFVGGAVVYSLANLYLARHGAKHRKRSQGRQPSEQQKPGSGLAIAAGSLLDGIPESIVIGSSLVAGGAISYIAVGAVFLSDIPEGLSSAAGMKRAGRPAAYIFGVWVGLAFLMGVSSLAGYVIFSRLPPTALAAATATAAGAILAMIADTMMPEAFEEAHDLSGLITVLGFLAAFVLAKI